MTKALTLVASVVTLTCLAGCSREVREDYGGFGAPELIILLFLAAVAFAIFKKRPEPAPTAGITSGRSEPGSVRPIEERIRELDNLRAKQLITDDEYSQRKKDIIASL